MTLDDEIRILRRWYAAGLTPRQTLALVDAWINQAGVSFIWFSPGGRVWGWG